MNKIQNTKKNFTATYLNDSFSNDHMSNELVERIRKRKCFADKDLEKLAPNPNEENVSTTNLPNISQEFPKQKKFSSSSESGYSSYMTKNENLQNHLITNIINSGTFSSVNSLDTFSTFAAYYTHLLHLNSPYNLMQIPHIPRLNFINNNESKLSAFYEPTTTRINYPNETEKMQNISCVKENGIINNFQLSNQNLNVSENFKLPKSPSTKDDANNGHSKTKSVTHKFSNFSVDALLGVV